MSHLMQSNHTTVSLYRVPHLMLTTAGTDTPQLPDQVRFFYELDKKISSPIADAIIPCQSYNQVKTFLQ